MAILEFPDYPTMIVGIRERKQTKIFPLSLADARRFKNLFLTVLAGLNHLKGASSPEVGAFIYSTIEENIIVLANMVLEHQVEESELTIEQLTELADHIYTMNFEGTIKNFLSLWNKIQKERPKATIS